jgi:hypothetical protein
MLALEVEVLRTVQHPNIIHLYKCVTLSPPAQDLAAVAEQPRR